MLVHNRPQIRKPGQRYEYKPPVCATDATGKVHGDIPKSVPKSWSHDDLLEAEKALRDSIAVRKAEQLRLGEHGPHRARIADEENFLKIIVKVLNGT